MIVVRTFGEVRDHATGEVVLIPTMGYLHEGHLAHVSVAAERGDTVVMSLFVNPLQFDDPGDLDRYPREEGRDAELAERAGVDILFAPGVDEMYPASPTTRVTVGEVAEAMEGAHRPGHFDGVATVVAKLFAGIRPTAATFGRKDAQQLAVVKRMVRDLSFPVEIIEIPTLREADGLALSSRNVRLRDRDAARGLSEGLFAAADAVAAGERSADVLRDLVITRASAAGVEVEYVALADAGAAAPIEELDRPTFLAIAGVVDGVRLIDNVFMWPDGSTDRGTRLEQPSILGGT